MPPALHTLGEAGISAAILSNGTPTMLIALVNSVEFGSFFHELISVDEVRTYKPSLKVYQRAATRLDRPIGPVRLVSSNPFDVVGAGAAGMLVGWVDRSPAVFDTPGAPTVHASQRNGRLPSSISRLSRTVMQRLLAMSASTAASQATSGLQTFGIRFSLAEPPDILLSRPASAPKRR